MVVCKTNLKALGFGTIQYAKDHEEKIPCWGIEFDECAVHSTGPWNAPNAEQLARAFEWGFIWEYANAAKSYACPTLNNKMNPKLRVGTALHSNEVWGWPGTDSAGNLPGPMWSYSVNGEPGRTGARDSQWRANPDLVKPSPYDVFMLYEQDQSDYASWDNTVSLFNPIYNTNNNSEDSIGRYHMVSGEISYVAGSTFDNRRGSGNLVYFDGHVGDMSLEEYISRRSTANGSLQLLGGHEGFPGWD